MFRDFFERVEDAAQETNFKHYGHGQMEKVKGSSFFYIKFFLF